jgi:hypothetical protein
MTSKIKGVAILLGNKIVTGDRVKSHDDLIAQQNKNHDNSLSFGTRGFVTFDGRFLQRDEAAKVAKHHNQLTERAKDGVSSLYSDHLDWFSIFREIRMIEQRQEEEVYKDCSIVNIRRGTDDKSQWVYANLVDKDGKLLISATLDYIIERLKERL